MTESREVASDGGASEIAITVMVDADVIRRLDRERVSLAEPDLKTTVRRRLETSSRRLAHFEREDLLWPPPLRERRCVHVRLPENAVDQLRSQAERLDLDEQVLLTGILSDDLFASPLAIFDRDQPPSGYLRTERGRGRIYGMHFEVAGYQYAFLKAIGGEKLLPTQVLELACRCLAERIAGDDPPIGLRVSREAFTIAKEISRGLGRMRAPPG